MIEFIDVPVFLVECRLVKGKIGFIFPKMYPVLFQGQELHKDKIVDLDFYPK